MIQTAEENSLSGELKRFLIVAHMHKQETGQQAFMPVCLVDAEWHRLLEQPDDYNEFCHNAEGQDVRHEPAKGRGEISWTRTYEKLYGLLPEVWFQDMGGTLNMSRRQTYLDTGVFYASWDCTPG